MAVKYLKNPDPSGPELALCTRFEFDAMADALADKVGLRRRDMPMPAEVAEKISRGVSPLLAVRQWRALNRSRLHEISGVHRDTIKTMEHLNRTPANDVIRLALARALDVPPGWLG